MPPLDPRDAPSPPLVLPFWSGADAFEAIPDPAYLAPYFPEGAHVDLVGLPKEAGKTTLSCALSNAVVTGGPFLGGDVEPGPVVYLSEQPRGSFKSSMLRAGAGPHDDLHVAHAPELYVLGAPWESVARAAVDFADRVGAKLLVVDTVFGFCPADDENSSHAAAVAFGPLQDRPEGLTLLTNRHARKTRGSVVTAGRGSNAFAAYPDVLLHLTGSSGAPNARALAVSGRYGCDELHVAFDDRTYHVVPDPDDVGAAVLSVVGPGDELTRKDIVGRLDEAGVAAGPKRLDAALRDLVTHGALRSETLRRTGNPKAYSLPAVGGTTGQAGLRLAA